MAGFSSKQCENCSGSFASRNNPQNFNLRFKTLEDFLENKNEFYSEDDVVLSSIDKFNYCSEKCYNEAVKKRYFEIIDIKSMVTRKTPKDIDNEKEKLAKYKSYLEKHLSFQELVEDLKTDKLIEIIPISGISRECLDHEVIDKYIKINGNDIFVKHILLRDNNDRWIRYEVINDDNDLSQVLIHKK